ncbi:MAG: hypothetical protein ACP5OG_01430 [Candidatus Nanoarchaeia archaeon]
MRILKTSKVIFADEKIEKEFYSLDEDNEIKKHVRNAMKDIEQNGFCGIPIPKRLFPKIYIQKYSITNLWKYDLPNGWRLVYFISTPNKIEILAIILEWFNHKEYEQRFHY